MINQFGLAVVGDLLTGRRLSTHSVEINGISKRLPIQHPPAIPVQVPQPEMQTSVIVPDHLQIAGHDVVVRHVEADERRVQPDIRLGDVLAEEVGRVARLTEVCLQPIEGVE